MNKAWFYDWVNNRAWSLLKNGGASTALDASLKAFKECASKKDYTISKALFLYKQGYDGSYNIGSNLIFEIERRYYV